RVSVFALYGFAAWHILDAVFSHWVLGIHRIRMTADNPMAWDLGWLFVFGLIPLFWAWRLHRSSGASGGQGGLPSQTVSVLWAVSVSVAGLLSLWPVRAVETDTVVVLLRPDTAPAKLFEGMERAGARLLWSDAGGGVWVLKRPESIQPAFFYQYGALYVSGVGMATGCIDWFR